MAEVQFDVYQHVTDIILSEIEKGTPPWRQPWSGGAAALPQKWNGDDYAGINVILLWATAAARGYSSARWMTFRQAKELGGAVRKGEKSATSIKYGVFERANRDTGLTEEVPFARAYRVFNADQIEGLPQAFYIQPDLTRTFDTPTDDRLDAWLLSRGADIFSGDQPQGEFKTRRARRIVSARRLPLALLLDYSRKFQGMSSAMLRCMWLSRILRRVAAM